MANLFSEPSFETVDDWTLADSAVWWFFQVNPEAYDGDSAIRMQGLSDPRLEGSIVQQVSGLSVGSSYLVKGWVAARESSPAPPSASHLDADHSENGSDWTTFGTATDSDFGDADGDPDPDKGEYLEVDFGSFEATATTMYVRFRLYLDEEAPRLVTLWLDLVSMEEELAVKLSERAIDAVVTQLQADLGTELAAIDTDRADGITMAVPASGAYYRHPKAEITGENGTTVEVFENNDYELENPNTDAGSGRASFKVEIVVRFTVFTRDGGTADNMTDRKRRYAAGVANVFLNTPTDVASDTSVPLVTTTRVNLFPEFEAETVRKSQVEVFLTVSISETL